MTLDPSAEPGAFAERRPLDGEQLRALRAQIWADGSVSAAEAEALFDMNRSVEPSPEWSDFFVEALSDYLLSQGEPRGYVTEDEATWLIRRVNRDGKVETRAELELIVKLLEHAEYTPSALRRFALATLENTVLTGEGPTRSHGEVTPGRIDDIEAGLIRRLIFAPAGDGPARVSAAEAEMLFRLKDATLGKQNSPEWKRLFVQGVANHLMTKHSYQPASPAAERDLEKPYEARPFDHVLSHLGEGLPRPEELRESLLGEENRSKLGFGNEAEDSTEVAPGKADWLKRLYDQEREHDELELALLDFLAGDAVRPF